ncbi:hypothetical protein [Streptomyces sp. NBC_00454]
MLRQASDRRAQRLWVERAENAPDPDYAAMHAALTARMTPARP